MRRRRPSDVESPDTQQLSISRLHSRSLIIVRLRCMLAVGAGCGRCARGRWQGCDHACGTMLRFGVVVWTMRVDGTIQRISNMGQQRERLVGGGGGERGGELHCARRAGSLREEAWRGEALLSAREGREGDEAARGDRNDCASRRAEREREGKIHSACRVLSKEILLDRPQHRNMIWRHSDPHQFDAHLRPDLDAHILLR